MSINIKDLTKTYKNAESTLVFRKLNLEISKNEFLCIFGISGSGKSTLLNILSNLTDYDSGEIKFKYDNPKIGYVFQQDRLLPWLTVGKNLSLVLNHSNYSQQQKYKLIKEHLELVKLNRHLNKYPGQLSGGERQRVSIARALIWQPQILLLDEPFSHLDEIAASKLRQEIKILHSKIAMTTVFVTHNPLEAIYLADRIVILSKKKKGVANTIKVPHTNGKDNKLYETFIYESKTQKILKSLIKHLN